MQIENEKCFYTYCQGYDPKLAVVMMKNGPSLCNIFDITRETFKLLKNSSQRDTEMKFLRMNAKNVSKGIHTFCRTC